MQFRVDEPYYSQIVSGEKTVEGRVYRKKWKNIELGEIVVMTGRDLNKTHVEFVVVSLTICKNFEELYEIHGKKLLPRDENVNEVYLKFFTKEKIDKHGVIGIELQRLYR